MRIVVVSILFLAAALPAQEPPARKDAKAAAAAQAQQEELQRSLSEAGNSTIEFIRAIEKHLQKYPGSAEKPELERAMVKAAIDQQDNARILLYGERVLQRDKDDLQILERVTRALLADERRENAVKAFAYAGRMEEILGGVEKQQGSGRAQARMQEDLDRALGRALVLKARAA